MARVAKDTAEKNEKKAVEKVTLVNLGIKMAEIKGKHGVPRAFTVVNTKEGYQWEDKSQEAKLARGEGRALLDRVYQGGNMNYEQLAMWAGIELIAVQVLIDEFWIPQISG